MRVRIDFEVSNEDAREITEGDLFDYFSYMHSFGGRPSHGAIKAMACQFTPVGIEVSNEEAQAMPEQASKET